jgi:cyclopropane fatty-acyl-phospholipid synthase-like methyltransferase
MKPFAESCEINKDPILTVLREHFADRQRVLEIASGTGQHAVHFCRHLPHLAWHTSELPEHHAGIQAWLDEENLPNVLPPLALDVNDHDWPIGPFDAVFSANSVHIMVWPAVERLFYGTSRVLAKGGLLTLYGPFNYGGRFTSDSNARFDVWLKARDPNSGVRDFEALDALAKKHSMTLAHDIAMPSNNRTLIWRKA